MAAATGSSPACRSSRRIPAHPTGAASSAPAPDARGRLEAHARHLSARTAAGGAAQQAGTVTDRFRLLGHHELRGPTNGDVWLADPLRLLLSLGLFLLGVLVFFAYLQGLHRQLLAARRHYLEWAGQLYPRAWEPVRSGSLAALGEQAQQLQAAEVIQRRAEAIQQWPFQQRRLAQMSGIVGTVVTFVVTGIITRLILVRLGL
jgi:hypothetical protein